jgi:hypothetical protein
VEKGATALELCAACRARIRCWSEAKVFIRKCLHFFDLNLCSKRVIGDKGEDMDSVKEQLTNTSTAKDTI